MRPRPAFATLFCTALMAGACVERPPLEMADRVREARLGREAR